MLKLNGILWCDSVWSYPSTSIIYSRKSVLCISTNFSTGTLMAFCTSALPNRPIYQSWPQQSPKLLDLIIPGLDIGFSRFDGNYGSSVESISHYGQVTINYKTVLGIKIVYQAFLADTNGDGNVEMTSIIGRGILFTRIMWINDSRQVIEILKPGRFTLIQ